MFQARPLPEFTIGATGIDDPSNQGRDSQKGEQYPSSFHDRLLPFVAEVFR
jgi:hypothetical protein